MRKTLLIATSLGCVSLLSAQSKINPAGRLQIQEYRQTVEQTNGAQFRPLEVLKAPMIKAIVVLESNIDIARLNIDGLEIDCELDNIIIASLPLDRVEQLAELPYVKSIEFNRFASTEMNYARPASNVSEAQSGFAYNGETLKFDGTGVVAGIMDTGLQGNHVNFQNSDGDSRIKRIWWFKASNGTYTEYKNQTIRNFTTDNSSQSHATHVTGIMGGSYNGTGTYVSVPSSSATTSTLKTDEPIPYYGVATGADLALSVGSLSTSNIIQGVSKVIEYAESQGQPVVVNMSLGSTDGPHDGTDAYTQAISKLGERGIICMSAGNDGDANISITKEFTSSDKTVNTFITDGKGTGVVDIWGSDSSPLRVRWGMYDVSSRTVSYFIDVNGAGSGTSSGTNFSQYFSGSISVSSNVNSTNHRFQAYCVLNNVVRGSNGNKYLALSVEGVEGTQVWIYGSSDCTFSNKPYEANSTLVAGYVSGNPENSINGACCGDNIISVGAYNSRSTWGQFNAVGGAYYYSGAGHNVNAISPFSSYGTSFQGKDLPDVTAPGAAIISSISRYYVTAGGFANSMTARTGSGSTMDYWGVMQGTSMSCPFVSGTVAMWLQANPNLTYADVIEVIKESSTFNALQMRPAIRWGAGKIDAVNGLKYILENKPAAIGAVWEDDNLRFIVSATDGGYDVTLAGEAAFEVTVTDMQGRTVATAAGRDGAATVSTDGLQSGIYVISARGASACHSTKIAIR